MWPAKFINGHRYTYDLATIRAQHLAYETIKRLVQRPGEVIGCMVAYRERNCLESIPLQALTSKSIDWEVFSRMHGRDSTSIED
jgi:6-phosphofructokinase 1